jgi:hypothetical protein
VKLGETQARRPEVPRNVERIRGRNIVGVTSVSFWLRSWEHECCGPQRKVGDEIEATLLFQGDVHTTDVLPFFRSDRDGRCEAVGEIDQKVGKFTGYLVQVPGVTFAVLRGNPSGGRVLCDGKLWEQRHGPEEWPSGAQNTGRIEEIWYHRFGGNGEPDSSTRIYNTSKRPPNDGHWAFRIVIEPESE